MQQYAILLEKSRQIEQFSKRKGRKKGNKKFLNVHNFHKNIKLIDDELK